LLSTVVDVSQSHSASPFPLKLSTSSTGSHNGANSSFSSFLSNNPLELAERYEAEVMRKATERVREQENMQLSTEMIVDEAKATIMNVKGLTEAFEDLIVQLNSSKSTKGSILRSLILWEKAALAYIESHKSSASLSTAVAQRLPVSLVSMLSFIGQKTGIGKMKTVDPLLATALKNQLADILKQCIVITENDKNFNDCVRGLNQHQRYLVMNHSEAALMQGTVSSQFHAVTLAMTRVATNRFEYTAPTCAMQNGPKL
jgi:hypothetical protein